MADIVDHRGQADEVGRGVAVYLAVTKTGTRQAVMIEDAELAGLIVQWRDAVAEQDPAGSLFPAAAVLRATLARALAALDDGSWETRGLRFVWHSLRHGGASRAFLRGGGVAMPDILVRGRWKVEKSGRHYVQSGRMLLLALALPEPITDFARRLRTAGLSALLAADLRAQLGC